ncbi:MAG: hypothetical protein FD123_3558 [Bacteroidetes bacterium]|nr:MAG: hypothetical protein FD123_3558 [Bacteroidota bacterium]
MLLLAACVSLQAQKEKDKKWDVNNPPGDYKEAEFTTSEGTWMNLDVSPDGQQIVFDLLGDIYTLPTAGGTARAINTGHAFAVHPRFSPDGKKVSFTSDAGGGDNIWTMDADGSNAKQVTTENFRLLNNAVWTPAGDYLIARKHFTSTRSLGAGELWMYHTSGGEGVQLTQKKNSQQDLGEPCMSPDGEFVYYSEDMYPGGFFQYNKDPNSQIYVIKRYNLKTGETEVITGGSGGAVRPQVSRDGKLLAFVRRVHEKSVLFLRDLASGEEWPVFDGLSKDQQEAWAIFGVYSNFAWLPDNKHVIIWAQGKIWNIDITNGSAKEIPFTATCKHRLYNALRFKQDVAPDQFTTKMIRHCATSPDEKWIVFNAAGYLWKKEMPNGTPVRLTAGTDFEFEPAFSKDGNWLTFVTWNDIESGAIMKMEWKKAGAKPVKVTAEKGIFRTPGFSPDGKSIVFQKEDGNDHQGYAFCVKPGIYSIPATGGKATFLFEEGLKPSYSADGKQILYFNYAESKELKSYDIEKKTKRVVCTSKYSTEMVPSPDNAWIAFTELFKAYVAAFPQNGKSLDLSGKMGSVPVTQVARDAGTNLHWSADGKKLHWTTGQEYFTNAMNQKFSFVPGAPDSLPPMDSTGVKINLVMKSDKPQGVLAMTNARIITMKGDEVIESGTIIVKENRIADIGKTGEVTIPKEAKVIDCAGKTIIPGIVDVHAHLGTFRGGLSPQRQWSYYANLAYGVTTTHDPSSNSEMVFSQSEAVRAGNMVGPRIYSTGWILYGAEGDYKAIVNGEADARSAVARTQALGAFSVKSYNQPRREQRQQVITAARKLNMMVVPEGGSTSWYNLTHVMDGHTGVEHNLPYAPLFNDVVQLWKNSQTGYTPTLIVTYGALNGENYWYQHTNVWEKKHLLAYTPRSVIDERSRHRTMAPEEEYVNGHILVSQSCKKLADAGVKVNLGAHGQLQGLGAHWELWMLAQGGMSPLQALRCATLNGAWYIGMDHDIGSLEKGKLADLVVLDKNPLENIQNTEFVRYTMVNGRLYDVSTMNEIGNYDRKRGKLWFENNKYSTSFPFHEHTNDHGDGD